MNCTIRMYIFWFFFQDINRKELKIGLLECQIVTQFVKGLMMITIKFYDTYSM